MCHDIPCSVIIGHMDVFHMAPLIIKVECGEPANAVCAEKYCTIDFRSRYVGHWRDCSLLLWDSTAHFKTHMPMGYSKHGCISRYTDTVCKPYSCYHCLILDLHDTRTKVVPNYCLFVAKVYPSHRHSITVIRNKIQKVNSNVSHS